VFINYFTGLFRWMKDSFERQFNRLIQDPLLKQFNDFLVRLDLGLKRRVKYLTLLSALKRRFNLDISNIDEIVTWIKNRYTGYTKRDYLLTYKYYLRFIGRPEEADKIKATVKRDEVKNIVPTELLTPREIRKLIDSTDNIMYKALIYLLWEAGLRIGEILEIRREDIEETGYGYLIRVKGKTGVRSVPIIEAAPMLSLWLQQCNSSKIFPISYDAFRMYLKKLARKAGIKKRVYPHLFRHSRATYLAKKRVSESTMKKYFGWAGDSRMPAIYVHLAASDVEEAILNLYEEEAKKEKHDYITCWRCGHRNLPGSRYCSKCGSPLDQSRILERELLLQQLMDRLRELKKLRGGLSDV